MSRTVRIASPIVVLVLLAVCGTSSTAGAASATRLAGGKYHTCALTTRGGVKCWGANTYGQLGDGTTTDKLTPTDVVGLTSGVASIVAGWQFTCAVTTGGAAKCWGVNSVGQLGDGTNATRTTPVLVTGLSSGVASMAAGAAFACALTTGGAVKCWGDDYWGQLGDGATGETRTPVDVINAAAGIATIAAGDTHACAATSGGAVRCWGANDQGQLGDGTTTPRHVATDVPALSSGITRLAAGAAHTCALTSGGGVRCWGANYLGQLGDGTATSHLTPTAVPGLTAGVVVAGQYHTCVVTTAGGAKCWGSNASSQVGDGGSTRRDAPVDVSGLTAQVVALGAGSAHTCAATTGGGVECWGENDHGQLGRGTTTTKTTPLDVLGLTSGAAGVRAGSMHTCGVTETGGVRCWGSNDNGQLGDGTTTNRPTPTAVSGLATGASSVDGGKWHTCALTTGGGVKCWGYGGYGALGHGATAPMLTPTDVSGLTSGAAAIATGDYHSCAVTTGGAAKCWGNNNYGQVGDGTTETRLTPTSTIGLASGVASIDAGNSHTCAVTTTGGLKCWGSNDQGQVGDGTKTNRLTAVDVLGLTSGVAAVATGSWHTCALTTGGGVKCWGYAGNGQLGDNATFSSTATPVNVSGLASGVAAIGAGTYHTCAVTTGGAVKCWGDNSYGQLGDGTTNSSYVPVSVPGLASGVTAVTLGEQHTCALLASGGVKCWGWSRWGQVGETMEPPLLGPVRALRFGRPDFDGDDKVDFAVYRPSTGTWFSMDSSSGNTSYRYRGWGLYEHGDIPVVGDFDGDGIIDPTVFRPTSGTWFMLLSGSNYTAWTWTGWGVSTDTLVPGDYDGDGKTDPAVFRSSTSTWYIKPSGGALPWNTTFGEPGDVPVAGDFDGDGKRDPAVYRPSTGTWFWLKSTTNFFTYAYKGWGVDAAGDQPAPGDYDGDGKTDPCVFRPSTGSWFYLASSTYYSTWDYFGWGGTGDTLVPADYDGDGKTDGAVYRSSSGTWYVRPSSGAAGVTKVFGDPTDVVLVTIR